MMTAGSSSFSSQELARVLSHYDLGIIRHIRSLAGGSRSAPKMVVTAEKGKFIIKRRPHGKDNPQRVTFAHSVQKHLKQRQFPVAGLIATIDENDTVLHLGSHIYELFEFVTGRRYDESLKETMDAGRQLGVFHLYLRSFSSEIKPPCGGFHDSRLVRTQLKSLDSEKSSVRPSDQMRVVVQNLMTLYNGSAIHVNELGFDSWREQIIHGDWHPGNMLFSHNKIAAVLDFDSTKLASPITDLANGLLQFSIVAGRPNPANWPDYLDDAKLISFLEGYRKVVKLQISHLNALLDLMIETMIAEAVLPVAATGSFGNLSGVEFLEMIYRKCRWITENREMLAEAIIKQEN
ncbi:MAG: phosphotransferase [Planctomycetota bacterium]